MKGIKTETFKGIPWRWVRVGDLASYLGLTPAEVWRRFFYLSKDGDILPVLSVRDRAVLHCEVQDYPGPDAHVPAGWAQDVLTWWERGVREVRRGLAYPDGASWAWFAPVVVYEDGHEEQPEELMKFLG